MKIRRFCLSRKKFTPAEADQEIQKCFQGIQTHNDNILYWIPKIGTKLDFLDMFILGTDKLETPEEFIKMSQDEISFLSRKIYEDYGRYVEVKNKLF